MENHPPTSSAAAASRSRLPLVIGAAAATLVALSLGIWALASGASNLTADVIENDLPPKTLALGQSPLLTRDGFIERDPTHVTSRLSALVCDGPHLSKILEIADGASLDRLSAFGILDVFSQDNLAEGLSCGRDFREGLRHPFVVEVLFEDDGESSTVTLVDSEATSIPVPSHNFSGLAGFCEPEEDDASRCADDGHAAVKKGDRWAVGKAEAVEAFARAWSTERATTSTNVEVLRALADHIGDAPDNLMIARPETIPFRSVCERLPSSDASAFRSACFPSGQTRVIDAITVKTRAFAYLHWPPLDAGEWRFEYVFVGRDDDAAEDLAQSLDDLRRDWAAHAENGEPTMLKLLRNDAESADRRRAATLAHAFVRALREMEVERDGATVKLVMASPLSDEDEARLREIASEGGEKRSAAEAILTAILEGVPIPGEALRRFVDPHVADWMLLPRATKSDCEAFAARLAALTEGDVPVEEFGAKYRLERRFADAEACEGRVLEHGTRDCLADAASLTAMDACELPVSPFVRSAEERLEGRWFYAPSDGDPYLNWRDKKLLDGAGFEIAGGKVAFRLGDVASGPLDLRAESTTAAAFAIPGRDDSHVVVRFDDEVEGRIRVIGLARSGELTFERRPRGDDLFALADEAAR